jgi:hypothetical protein
MENLKGSITDSFVTFENILKKITDKLCVGLKENDPDSYLLNAIFGARALGVIKTINDSLDRIKEEIACDD